MTRRKPRYQVQTSDRGHQAPGLDSETQRTLAERGLLKEKPKKSKAQRKRAKKRASNSEAPTNSEAELPSRSRRKLPRQSRHFRFMLEVDEKLQDLVDHYDGTMTYVMSRLIHEEWVRMKRKERRSAKKEADDDAEGSARDAG